MRASGHVLYLLGGLLLTLPTPASAGRKGNGDPSPQRLHPAVARMLREAKVVRSPFEIRQYEAYSRTGEGPLTVYHTEAAADGQGASRPLKYIFFHGAGQAADCELVSRLAIGFRAAGLNMEIHSIPYTTYGGFDTAIEIVRSSPDKVLVGGHSAGGGPTQDMVRYMPDKVAAVVTVNAFKPRAPQGIPSLHFEGENDGGAWLRDRMQWGDRLVQKSPSSNVHERFVVMREGDHSARYRPGIMSKDDARTSADTARMNAAMGEALKMFLGEIGVLEAPKE